jgi:hypothetical protein
MLLPYIEQLTAQLAKSSVKQHWAGSKRALTGNPSLSPTCTG